MYKSVMKKSFKGIILGLVVLIVLSFIPVFPKHLTPKIELTVLDCDGHPASNVTVSFVSSSPYESLFGSFYKDRISDEQGKVVFESRKVHVSLFRYLFVQVINAMSYINPHVDTRTRTLIFFKDRASGSISFLDGESSPVFMVYCKDEDKKSIKHD